MRLAAPGRIGETDAFARDRGRQGNGQGQRPLQLQRPAGGVLRGLGDVQAVFIHVQTGQIASARPNDDHKYGDNNADDPADFYDPVPQDNALNLLARCRAYSYTRGLVLTVMNGTNVSVAPRNGTSPWRRTCVLQLAGTNGARANPGPALPARCSRVQKQGWRRFSRTAHRGLNRAVFPAP